MSKQYPNGGPAFPACVRDSNKRLTRNPGMSLRDWFAGQAPEVPDWFMRAEDLALARQQPSDLDGTMQEWDAWSARELAFLFARTIKWRWEYADAMIAARAESNGGRA